MIEVIIDLFSKRQRAARGELRDIFTYDEVPQQLRVQVVHIWRDGFGKTDGEYGRTSAGTLVKNIYGWLCREYGVFSLGSGHTYFDRLTNFFLACSDTTRVLDVIELTFRAIDRIVRSNRSRYDAKMSPDDAIEELNARFREHGVGFEYQSGEMIRVDSKVLHQSAVKPALKLLSDKRFRGANEEFLQAFEHYRQDRFKESMNECLKAFESTLKIICKERGWSFNENATAKSLIDVVLANHLLPLFLQSQFTALRALLESGIPTGRNKLSGHGQGAEALPVPRYFASYILHLTATTILLLVEASKEKG